MGGYGMTIIMDAPWHKASFDRFLHERLPYLLAEHIPLLGYTATATDPYTCQIELTLSSPTGEVIVAYAGLPQPDQEGVFQIDGKRLVVVPYAAHDDLENAEIFCVGEQLEAHLRQRLGKAPDDLAWDTALARAWLPLNLWIGEFFERPHATPGRRQIPTGPRSFNRWMTQTGWPGTATCGASPSWTASTSSGLDISGAPAPLKHQKARISGVSCPLPWAPQYVTANC